MLKVVYTSPVTGADFLVSVEGCVRVNCNLVGASQKLAEAALEFERALDDALGGFQGDESQLLEKFS